MKKVVVIGGGTGVFTVLTGLKEHPYKLSAIVSMADDGGSTGVLREEFGTLPAGDIRRALIALSDQNKKVLSDLFNYRFGEETSLKGHSLGNLLLTALEKITGNFEAGLEEASKILNLKGNVVPVTLVRTRLFAELDNGEIIEGETNIDIPKHDGNLTIKSIFLNPKPLANKKAIDVIKKADAIILGPGDLYTSIMPNLIVEGIADAIKSSKGKVIYNVNIMTKYGETNNYAASDFVKKVEEVLGQNVIDYITVNVEKPTGEVFRRYQKENDEFVVNDLKDSKKVIEGKFLRNGMFLRHDPAKLARALRKIID